MKDHGPLAGVRVVEIAGIGPAPFCGMLLADLGADVVVVDRVVPNPDTIDLGRDSILNRGKRFMALDLKQPEGIEGVLNLVKQSHALIEGMRPGVMERLGLGPDICFERNAALVFGRMTGWGQHGPLAQAAGHDINYIALSGALWYAGEPGSPPITPPGLVGDIGGGALYLAVGLLAAILSARETGKGQVVDAAIVDGSAHMMNLLLSLRAAGHFVTERSTLVCDVPMRGRPLHLAGIARAKILRAAKTKARPRRRSGFHKRIRSRKLARPQTAFRSLISAANARRMVGLA